MPQGLQARTYRSLQLLLHQRQLGIPLVKRALGPQQLGLFRVQLVLEAAHLLDGQASLPSHSLVRALQLCRHGTRNVHLALQTRKVRAEHFANRAVAVAALLQHLESVEGLTLRFLVVFPPAVCSSSR
jgi:hypothetical protein